MAQAAPVPDHTDLAALLLGRRRVVVLTGLHLGGREHRDPTGAAGEWAVRASLDALVTDPAAFWAYYAPLAHETAGRRPRPGHEALARLEQAGVVDAVITQAVDRLHRAAGNEHVVEVHGHLLSVRCERCGERYGLPELDELVAASADGVPRCTTRDCAFPLRPDGTLWNEPLPPEAIRRAWDLAAAADCFVVIDCELRTVPISLLPSVPLTRQVPLVIIGEAATQYDRYAERVLRGPSERILVELADLLCPVREG